METLLVTPGSPDARCASEYRAVHRAYRVHDLLAAAQTLGPLSTLTWHMPLTKQDVLELIAAQFCFPHTLAKILMRSTTA